MSDDCAEVHARLQIYLDGEGSPDLEVFLRTHLGDCPPCMERADFEQRLRSIVASRCREQAPAGLLDRILARLEPPF